MEEIHHGNQSDGLPEFQGRAARDRRGSRRGRRHIERLAESGAEAQGCQEMNPYESLADSNAGGVRFTRRRTKSRLALEWTRFPGQQRAGGHCGKGGCTTLVTTRQVVTEIKITI